MEDSNIPYARTPRVADNQDKYSPSRLLLTQYPLCPLLFPVRIIQTIASTRVDHGGTSRSVPALCDELVAQGIDNYLVTALPFDSAIHCNLPKDRSRVRLMQESRIGRQWGLRKQLLSELKQLIGSRTDDTLIHDHAVWLPSNHYVAYFCRRHKIRRVVSPRGMLGHWSMQHGGLKKRIAWYLYQRRDLITANGFHVTSAQEHDEVRALGFKQPIVIAANGVDLPEQFPDRTLETPRTVLFMSRIHPKKGIDLLLQAWHSLQVSGTWKLIIAGSGEPAYLASMKKLVSELKLEDQVSFVGELTDETKWQAYADADLFVLPSHNENFGIVIAEAMAAGIPVITTKNTPWSVLTTENLGWWIDLSVENLSDAMRGAMNTPRNELQDMGKRASYYAKNNFSWTQSAQNLISFYEDLMGRRA